MGPVGVEVAAMKSGIEEEEAFAVATGWTTPPCLGGTRSCDCVTPKWVSTGLAAERGGEPSKCTEDADTFEFHELSLKMLLWLRLRLCWGSGRVEGWAPLIFLVGQPPRPVVLWSLFPLREGLSPCRSGW